MTAGSSYASSMVREDFLEEVALQLDQGRRERRHIPGREWSGYVPKAGACPVCGDPEHGRGQAVVRDGGGVRAEGGTTERSRQCRVQTSRACGAQTRSSGVKAQGSPQRFSPGYPARGPPKDLTPLLLSVPQSPSVALPWPACMGRCGHCHLAGEVPRELAGLQPPRTAGARGSRGHRQRRHRGQPLARVVTGPGLPTLIPGGSPHARWLAGPASAFQTTRAVGRARPGHSGSGTVPRGRAGHGLSNACPSLPVVPLLPQPAAVSATLPHVGRTPPIPAGDPRAPSSLGISSAAPPRGGHVGSGMGRRRRCRDPARSPGAVTRLRLACGHWLAG